MNSIDTHKRNPKTELEKERQRIERWKEKNEVFDDWIYRIIPESQEETEENSIFPEENLLYFIEKYSPNLEPWQREICKIVRTLSQYFYPQMQTKVLHEGMASFSHYYIMNRLYENGEINEGQYLEFIDNHSGVVFQTTPDFRTEEEKKKSRFRKIPYQGINPYALGLAIFQDVRRICENPDQEDKEWFPHLKNEDWRDVFLDMAANYRDESLIRQFMGPKVARDFKFLAINDTSANPLFMNVQGDHSNPENIRTTRRILANNYEINRLLPNIYISKANMKKNRVLHLEHLSHNNQTLDPDTADKTLSYIARLWGYPVSLSSWVQNDRGEYFKEKDFFRGNLL